MDKIVHILQVEDNEGDIALMKEAFRQSKMETRISLVNDGQEALDFLFRRPPFKDVDMPDLILLDINLPKVDGIEVLKVIKSDSKLKMIPVVMLSTSSNEKDIQDAYSTYANSYITKPHSLDELMTMIRSLEEYWVSIARLPTVSA